MRLFENKSKSCSPKRCQPLASISLAVLLMSALIIPVGAVNASGGGESTKDGFTLYPLGETSGIPRLSDEPAPYAVVPERPALPIEWGCKFLGNGLIERGFVLPGGAVWTPCLLVFGTNRTALQTFQSIGPPGRVTELRNRLDIFANLQLTQTEKCIIGLGATDDNDFTKFSGYGFTADNRPELEGSEYEGPYVRALFCEGDFGALFPNLDRKGAKHLDWGFAFGRQQLTFQEGIMINDVQDGIGIVRNTINSVPGISNIRFTAWAGLKSIDRGTPANIQRLSEPGFYGTFWQFDAPVTTWALDIAALKDTNDQATGGDGYFLGIAATQRAWSPWHGLGVVNTTYRVNSSFADGDETPLMQDGTLVSAEFSWTPHNSDDVVYINPFWNIDNFTQAGREPIVGGPLAPLGISFASPSLGNHLSELNSFTAGGSLVGIAMGYQAFWDQHRRNLVIELAGTSGLDSGVDAQRDSAALTVQFQQAIKQHYLLQLDAFVSYLEGADNGSGARIEFLVQF